jgi:acetyl-CoA C-acetyltransferase
MTRSVIVGAVRTPVGRFGSALRSRSAVELGAVAIAEALARAGVSSGEVDYVLMGQVLQAGTGQITARQAAIAAGVAAIRCADSSRTRIPVTATSEGRDARA